MIELSPGSQLSQTRVPKSKNLRLILFFFFFILVIVMLEGGFYFFRYRKASSGSKSSITQTVKNSTVQTASDNEAVIKHFNKSFPRDSDVSVKPDFLGFNQQSKNIINVYGILKKVDVNKKILTLDVGDDEAIDFLYNSDTQFWLKPAFMEGTPQEYQQQSREIKDGEISVGDKLKLVYQGKFDFPWMVFKLL